MKYPDGTRVRVTGGGNFSTGQIVTVVCEDKTEPDTWCICTDEKRRHSKKWTDLEPIKEAKVKYKKLKDISVQAIDAEGPCRSELLKFSYLAMKGEHFYEEDIFLTKAVEYAEQCDLIPWMIKHGFIAEDKPEIVYPCIREAFNGEIVLFTSSLVGVVIGGGHKDIGKTRDNWAKDQFPTSGHVVFIKD